EQIVQSLRAWKLLVCHAHPGFLLGAVADELAADHFDVRVDLILMLIVAVAVGRAMKCVRVTMTSDETLAFSNQVEKSFLAVSRHGRLPINALFLDQVALGLKEKGVEFAQCLGHENSPVLRTDDLEAVAFTESGHDLFGQRQLVALALNDRMLKSLGARKHEQPGFFPGFLWVISSGKGNSADAEGGGRAGAKQQVATI